MNTNIIAVKYEDKFIPRTFGGKSYSYFTIIKLNEEHQEIRKIHDVFQEGEGYVEENRCFLQCIREEKPVPCTFTDGRKVLEISKKILETSSR